MFEALFKDRPMDTDIEGITRQQRAEALEYVRTLFPDATPEEISDSDLSNILTAKFHAADCVGCTDISRCRHSRAIFVVHPVEMADGTRRYTTSATLCGAVLADPDKKRTEKLFAESGLPKKATFAGFNTLDNIELKAAKGLAQRCAREGLGMIIGGPVGCGKTHLATAVAMERIAKGFTVAFYSSPNMFEAMRRDIALDSTDTLDRVRACDLLIIDDIGVERIKKNKSDTSVDWTEERLFMIIDHRYLNRKPVIITTNATNMEQLKGMLGVLSDRLCSRLTEMCKVLWLKNVEDYRQIITKGSGM